ncbi:MAG: glycosyl hydrolase family 18 protein [Bacteroidota bacterium]|nr:glycosyl hydrolase family 18 protein [Bacteroidota bacterium]
MMNYFRTMRFAFYLLLGICLFSIDGFSKIGLPEKKHPVVNSINYLIDRTVEQKVEPKEKQKKIEVVRKILQHPEGIADSIKQNDTILKRFTLCLRKRCEVFGYLPYWMNNNCHDLNLSLFTTLAFYGYELDEKTGGYKTLNGWDTITVIDAARKAKCKISLCVYSKNKDKLKIFLKSKNSQKTLASKICTQLEKRKADGVNIMFDDIDSTCRQSFTKFVQSFSQSLKSVNDNYQITITVPVIDQSQVYDIQRLDSCTDRFVIDFTKRKDYGAIAPLRGVDYSLEAGIARYLSSGVSSSKFIACVPYYGALWDFQTKEFIKYVKYNRVMSDYASDYGSISDKNGVRIDAFEELDSSQLWYDDARTLSEKYNLILQNKLGGVGIWALGYDNNQSELCNALIDNLIYVDSTNVTVISTKLFTIWDGVKKELALYKFLFQHPCQFNDEMRREMKLDNYIGYITLTMVILLMLVTVFYIARIRVLDDDWVYRKIVLRLLIFMVVITMISVLMYCFLSPDIESFGISDPDKCETSFGVILQILGIGFIIGLLAMKLLVVPLTKPKDTP